MPRVTVEIKDHIAQVTLSRGDKMNAVDIEMAEAIVATGEQLKETPNVRAVVLAGEGGRFARGLTWPISRPSRCRIRSTW